jgi:NAD(P)-dependent dehydrogenase (short-subunit alcohol dehydrogenase family)
MGARVVITARDEWRGRLALSDIRELSGSDDVEVMPLDLARLASVGDLVATFADRFDRLDVLINNAGITMKSRHETEDGNEMTLQVNHLGRFMLTHLLRDMLVAGTPSRVVNITSSADMSARRADLDDLQSSHRYTAHSAYAKSKLAAPGSSSAVAQDDAAARRLWEMSEQLVGL